MLYYLPTEAGQNVPIRNVPNQNVPIFVKTFCSPYKTFLEEYKDAKTEKVQAIKDRSAQIKWSAQDGPRTKREINARQPSVEVRWNSLVPRARKPGVKYPTV